MPVVWLKIDVSNLMAFLKGKVCVKSILSRTFKLSELTKCHISDTCSNWNENGSTPLAIYVNITGAVTIHDKQHDVALLPLPPNLSHSQSASLYGVAVSSFSPKAIRPTGQYFPSSLHFILFDLGLAVSYFILQLLCISAVDKAIQQACYTSCCPHLLNT